MTESEAACVAALLFATTAMAAAWLMDVAGFPIVPVAVLVLAIVTTAVALVSIAGGRGSMLSFSLRRFAAFVALTAGFALYILWLAWPSLFPVTQGPDVVHHLSLIHFIQRRHALPHDPALGAYLGEMASYTPGSHLLAALLGEWFRVDAIHLVHPIQAGAAAIKAGLVFCTLIRLVPERGSAPAVVGTLLLWLPYRYLLEPIVVFGFFSQVLAETFAAAMLWAMVVWDRQPSRGWLALAGTFGVAVVLCWPVYFPAAALATAIVIVLRWWRNTRGLGTVAVDLVVALGPAVLTAAIFSVLHASSAGILRSGGSVLVPGVDVFGWPFLLISTAGLIVSMRQARTVAPVLAFAAACALQIAALAAAQSAMGVTNLYLANKTVFLLVIPAAILGGYGLDVVARRVPFNAAPILAVAILLVLTRPPLRPLDSPISEPVYRAGVWAKANVPAACVDYMVDRWITGYWLHLDVLGNPRASERMRTETFEYRTAVSRWLLPGGLPYAIVENLHVAPLDARRNMEVLYEVNAAAVVRRADGRGVCPASAPPIDQVGNTALRR